MEQVLQILMRNARAEEHTYLYMLNEEAHFDQERIFLRLRMPAAPTNYFMNG
ncbi:hypothetical protein [Paenibacillus xylanexedens]|uniref:hypothetical protein n=1 Tax=Paenibacillus xylanexedens TaxID=528191 RepID=UPI0016432C7D|nr:hypothetical protein [Paenibacillus xylanexedens]